jgi:hypothetical protein
MQFAENRFPGKTTEAIVQGNAASAVLHYAVLKNTLSAKSHFANIPGRLRNLQNRNITILLWHLLPHQAVYSNTICLI